MEDQSHTLDDVYRLIETLKSEFSTSFRVIHDDIASLKTDVSQIKQDFQTLHREMVDLSAKTDHLDTQISIVEPRVESCETRIAALEDNLDDHIRDSPHIPPEEFPVDTTLVCSGLRADRREDITSVAQNIIDNGLGLINVNVVRARRLVSRNQKPGLVKIQLPTTADKVAALRCKRNLMDTGYRGVYIRSSSSHTDRILHQNFMTILKELPNGENFRVTSNGKLVPKDEQRAMGAWTRGPPVSAPHQIEPGVTEV